MEKEQRALLQASVEALQNNMAKAGDSFYEELFNIDPSLKEIFDIPASARRTKFVNMISTLARAKNLDKIARAMHELGKRHAEYGVHDFQFDPVKQALVDSLAHHLGPSFDRETRRAWIACFDEIEALMQIGMSNSEGRLVQRNRQDNYRDESLLRDIGDIDIITRVHKRFYDWAFDDVWLGRFFAAKNKESLIMKQTDFMVSCFGGENRFHGDTPAIAHMHMLVTDDMFDLRQFQLRRCILAEGLSEEIVDRWLKVDGAFRQAIVRQSKDQCVMRCVGQVPLVAEKPPGYPWPRR